MTTDLDLDVVRVAPKGAGKPSQKEEQDVARVAPKGAEKPSQKQDQKKVAEKSKEVAKKASSAVDKAIANGDNEALLAVLQTDQCTMADLRIGLNHLVANNRVESAMDVIKEKGYKPRQLE